MRGKNDSRTRLGVERGIVDMYAIAEAVIYGNEEESGIVEEGERLADLFLFLFHGTPWFVALRASDNSPAAK